MIHNMTLGIFLNWLDQQNVTNTNATCEFHCSSKAMQTFLMTKCEFLVGVAYKSKIYVCGFSSPRSSMKQDLEDVFDLCVDLDLDNKMCTTPQIAVLLLFISEKNLAYHIGVDCGFSENMKQT